ncbi:MAG: DUF374 domain-containing protein [Planctomycetota bacterium]|nr:MAG: DUF374 domain-containing protein [Planctomycetota bacterium]
MLRRRRPWRKRIKRFVKRALLWLAVRITPVIYRAYLRFVWYTSKIRGHPLAQKPELLKEHRVVAVLWHQDVFLVPWLWRLYRPITIASTGDSGEVIASILRPFGFTVFRGGSSKGRRRRKPILWQFIEYLKTQQRFVAGITVDGSSGPPFRMKKGAVFIAAKTGACIYLVRAWCRYRFHLPTWDRTVIPLPFNQIYILIQGPFEPPYEDSELEKFKNQLEKKLLDLTYGSFLVAKSLPHKLLKLFPPDWRPPQLPPDWHPSQLYNGEGSLEAKAGFAEEMRSTVAGT